MEWRETNNALEKEFHFADFKSAFKWMTKAAEICEDQNHHPTWANTYNKVQVKLTTHDAGNSITEKDRKLAEALDSIQ